MPNVTEKKFVSKMSLSMKHLKCPTSSPRHSDAFHNVNVFVSIMFLDHIVQLTWESISSEVSQFLVKGRSTVLMNNIFSTEQVGCPVVCLRTLIPPIVLPSLPW